MFLLPNLEEGGPVVAVSVAVVVAVVAVFVVSVVVVAAVVGAVFPYCLFLIGCLWIDLL